MPRLQNPNGRRHHGGGGALPGVAGDKADAGALILSVASAGRGGAAQLCQGGGALDGGRARWRRVEWRVRSHGSPGGRQRGQDGAAAGELTGGRGGELGRPRDGGAGGRGDEVADLVGFGRVRAWRR